LEKKDGAMAINPSQKRYPPEVHERAVRMVNEAIREAHGERYGVIPRIARQFGIGEESLRSRVNQAQVDGGKRHGVSTEEHADRASPCGRAGVRTQGVRVGDDAVLPGGPR
jgi:transposase-like protein